MLEKRLWLRWMFKAAGTLLLLLILPRIARNREWLMDIADRFAPDDRHRAVILLTGFFLALIAVGGLCWITAWGLKHQLGWARWTGIAASAGLVPIFPWMTIPGFVGLAILAADPPKLERATEDRSRLRRTGESPFQFITSLLAGAMLIASLGWLASYARQLHLPDLAAGKQFFAILVGGQLVVVAIHEFGHAIVAWAVGFRFKSICIGPITTWRDGAGRRFYKFEWKKLLFAGGYMGSSPTSPVGLRFNQILVVFAGPFASLNASLLLFLLLHQLPGTMFEPFWEQIGFLAVMFAVDFVGNLIPIGFTDGTLLLHLILWTGKGREFSSAWLSSRDCEIAEESFAQTDYRQEVAALSRVLDRSRVHGETPSAEFAIQYQALGFAQLRAGQVGEAEKNLLSAVEICEQCRGLNPGIAANNWLGLHRIYHIEQRAADAQRAARLAIQGFDRIKEKLPGSSCVEVHTALARLDLDSRSETDALREIEQASGLLPLSPDALRKRAELFTLRSQCESRLGNPEAALDAADEAARLLQSAEMPETDRVLAAQDLGSLGVTLWSEGRTGQGVALLTESIRLLEQLGVAGRSATLGIVLSEVLRKARKLVEAEEALPAEAGLTETQRAQVITEKAHIQLLAGRVDEAVTGFQQALELYKGLDGGLPTAVATAQGVLSDALIAAGRLDEAEVMAKLGCETLLTTEHPDAAGALINLAIIGRLKGQPLAESHLDQALQLIARAPLLEPATKARYLESEADILDRFGWNQKAMELRELAGAHWHSLGIQPDSRRQPAIPDLSRLQPATVSCE
jgi:tetratricopeptide (TPR) repeat protein